MCVYYVNHAVTHANYVARFIINRSSSCPVVQSLIFVYSQLIGLVRIAQVCQILTKSENFVENNHGFENKNKSTCTIFLHN